MDINITNANVINILVEDLVEDAAVDVVEDADAKNSQVQCPPHLLRSGLVFLLGLFLVAILIMAYPRHSIAESPFIDSYRLVFPAMVKERMNEENHKKEI
ncbi:hypothetical protein [Brevibacillus daliensis]|uniref:hypothetical protein n=1 Tax=Brevibacillus daliensis TaxID=2892995 RepID=UPI001E31C502|nr:hypothetical protein [Brevibacillus daliensis]